MGNLGIFVIFFVEDFKNLSSFAAWFEYIRGVILLHIF